MRYLFKLYGNDVAFQAHYVEMAEREWRVHSWHALPTGILVLWLREVHDG